MIMIQSRRPEKEATVKHVKLTHKGPLPPALPPLILFDPKHFQKTFPSEVEPATWSAKKEGARKVNKEERRESKSQKKTEIIKCKFCFLRMNPNFAS